MFTMGSAWMRKLGLLIEMRYLFIFIIRLIPFSDCPTALLNAIVNDVLLDVQDPSKESPLHSGFEAIQNRE